MQSAKQNQCNKTLKHRRHKASQSVYIIWHDRCPLCVPIVLCHSHICNPPSVAKEMRHTRHTANENTHTHTLALTHTHIGKQTQEDALTRKVASPTTPWCPSKQRQQIPNTTQHNDRRSEKTKGPPVVAKSHTQSLLIVSLSRDFIARVVARI